MVGYGCSRIGVPGVSELQQLLNVGLLWLVIRVETPTKDDWVASSTKLINATTPSAHLVHLPPENRTCFNFVLLLFYRNTRGQNASRECAISSI